MFFPWEATVYELYWKGLSLEITQEAKETKYMYYKTIYFDGLEIHGVHKMNTFEGT